MFCLSSQFFGRIMLEQGSGTEVLYHLKCYPNYYSFILFWIILFNELSKVVVELDS